MNGSRKEQPMIRNNKTVTRAIEVMLVVISIGLTCLLYRIAEYKMVVLNLYFLPVVLGAFVLGRYRAGVLALLCVSGAVAVTMLDMQGFQPAASPLMVMLMVTVWGATLGLTTMLVGSLSDERSVKLVELHDAYLGMVEVLSSYLGCMDEHIGNRTTNVSELSCQVAAKLKLKEEEIDDIRVAAMLQDIENIEVTARVISRAIGDIGHAGRRNSREKTFRGTDLVESLANVVYRALPLVRDQEGGLMADSDSAGHNPLGAQIIQTVRRYDQFLYAESENPTNDPAIAIEQLRAEEDEEHSPAILDALTNCVLAVRPARRQLLRRSAEESRIIEALTN